MQEERSEKRRVVFIAAMVGLALAGLGMRLGYLHLLNHSKLKRNYTRDLLGIRGRIFDCNGEEFPMAASLPARRFFVDPMAVKENHSRKLIIDTLADALALPREEVADAFSQTNSRYVKIAVSYDDTVFDLLSDATCISGVGSEDVMVRSYPHGHCMAHILGFVNNDGIGSAGIEQRYDAELRGTPGLQQGEVEGKRRRELWRRRKVDIPPIPGNDVHLTLDHNIQRVVEQSLQEVVEQFNAASGWAIVQDVHTGAILAMGTYPGFHPERYNEESKETWRNHALAAVYEPGSIMKAVTVAAALNERLVTANTVMDAGDGVFMWAGKPLRDHVTGPITIATALKKSSNIVCAKLGLMLTSQRLNAYLRGFGFGNTLGIDLPGEERGIIGDWKKWDGLKPTRVPIGQGVAVTGLQMVNAYSAIANGGKLMRPYVVDKIVSPSGEVVLQAKSEVIGSPIRPEVAQQVREMLIGVTEEGGTGKRADVKGYTVAGKTGTAQHAIKGGYSNTDYFASFVGFIPARAPAFCVLVSVDRPKPQHTGGYVAAPAFAKIATATARYLEVPPDDLEMQAAR